MSVSINHPDHIYNIQDLATSHRMLMGPGPSDVHPSVLMAMATPMIGHLDPEFIKIMDEIKEMAKQTFLTQNELTFIVSAPGSAGMETVLVNLLEPGDEAIICVHGAFGMRMADIAERCGAIVTRVEAPWGEPINPQDVKNAIGSSKPKLVSIVHAETSTGVKQPLQEISNIAHNVGALFVVDAVTSLAGTELRVDDWGIDAIYSGTQKCMSAPPGLSPISFSEQAVDVLNNRKRKVQSWFLDLSLVKNYWAGAKRAYHHTAPVSAMFAIREAYRLVLDEGLENRWLRHTRNHELLKNGLEAMGIEFLVAEEFRLPMLNAVKIPEGVDDAFVRSTLLNEYNIEIGAGLGQFAGKVWRIGLMGESSTPTHVERLLSSLTEIINK